MFTEEQQEQIQKIVAEAIAKDRERLKQSVDRILQHVDAVEENGKKRYGILFPFAERVVELEQRIKLLEKIISQGKETQKIENN